MAKVKTKNNTGVKTVEKTLWQYEYQTDNWIPEDDKRSASYKAAKCTGRIRSCVQTITTDRGTNETTVKQTGWVIEKSMNV